MSEAAASATVLAKLSKIFNKFKYGIMFYDKQNDEAFIIENGSVSPLHSYKKIKIFLDNDSINRVSINGKILESSNVYLNFVRFNIDSASFIIIFPDNDKYSINNLFISGLVLKTLYLSTYLKLENNESVELKDFLVNTLDYIVSDDINIDVYSMLDSDELSIVDCNHSSPIDGVSLSRLEAENLELRALIKERDEELVKLNNFSDNIVDTSKVSSHDEFMKRFNDLKSKMDEAIVKHKEERAEWEAERERLLSYASEEKHVSSYAAVNNIKKDKDSNQVSIDKDELEVLKDKASQLPLVRAHLDSANWEIKDKNNVIESLKEEMQKLKGASGSTSQTPKISNVIVGGSSDDKIIELKARIDMLEDLSIKQQVKINAKEEEIKELKESDPQELKKLRTELENKQLKIASLELDVDTMNVEKKYYNSEILELKNTIALLQKELADKSATNSELTDASNNNMTVELSRSLELANASISRLESSLSDTNSILQEKESIIREKESILQEKQEEIIKMKIDINNLKNTLSSANNKSSDRILDLENLEKLKDELRVVTLEKNRLSVESSAKDKIFWSFSNLVSSINSELASLGVSIVSYEPSLPIVCCIMEGTQNWGSLMDVFRKSNTDFENIMLTVNNSKEPVNVHLEFNDTLNKEEYSVTVFPIQNKDGSISPFVTLENIGIIKIIKNSIALLSNRNYDVNPAIHTEHDDNFQDLSLKLYNVTKDNELLKEKNLKMMKVLKTLTSNSDPSNIIALKSELLSYKNKCSVAEDLLKKYKIQIEQLTLKYADLNIKTYLQLEKVYTYLKSNSRISDEDVISGISLIEKNLNHLKYHLNRSKILPLSNKDEK